MRKQFRITIIMGLMLLMSLSTFAQDIPDVIEVSITYAPESTVYLSPEEGTGIIAEFNTISCNGAESRNPVTNEPLLKPICMVDLGPGSSGRVMQRVVDAALNSDTLDDTTDTTLLPGDIPATINCLNDCEKNDDGVHYRTPLPVIFQPSVSHWLSLANHKVAVGGAPQMFDITTTQPTTLTPAVLAIWESRRNAILESTGKNTVSWTDILNVLNSPNGWLDYGIDDERGIKYGHTDPFISSTALSTLVAEYYASARRSGVVFDNVEYY